MICETFPREIWESNISSCDCFKVLSYSSSLINLETDGGDGEKLITLQLDCQMVTGKRGRGAREIVITNLTGARWPSQSAPRPAHPANLGHNTAPQTGQQHHTNQITNVTLLCEDRIELKTLTFTAL